MDIYIPNSYTNIYYRIVNRSFQENRKRSDSKIYEEHHIIPKSCGGSNDISNLILLTPKEHYICHRLLPKMVKSKLHYEKMIYALWCLINGNGRSKRYSPSGKIYQMIKEQQSKTRSERMKGKNNSFYGKTHTEETKKMFSENNPAKRENVKAKLRGPRPGYLPHNHYSRWSNEVKQKLREANLGKIHSEETKLRMSETRKNKIWIKKAGEKSKHIHKDQFELYNSNGWVRGR